MNRVRTVAAEWLATCGHLVRAGAVPVHEQLYKSDNLCAVRCGYSSIKNWDSDERIAHEDVFPRSFGNRIVGPCQKLEGLVRGKDCDLVTLIILSMGEAVHRLRSFTIAVAIV